MREERMKKDAKTMSLGELAEKYGVSKQRIHEIIGSVTQYRKRYWGKAGYARRQRDSVRAKRNSAGAFATPPDDQ